MLYYIAFCFRCRLRERCSHWRLRTWVIDDYSVRHYYTPKMFVITQVCLRLQLSILWHVGLMCMRHNPIRSLPPAPKEMQMEDILGTRDICFYPIATHCIVCETKHTRRECRALSSRCTQSRSHCLLYVLPVLHRLSMASDGFPYSPGVLLR